jgi:uncharacterized membrane protein
MAELLRYDVIIHSDIKKEYFSDAQLNNMVQFVDKFGGGFCMVGGFCAYGSGGYQHTVIDRIIPVAMEELVDYTGMTPMRMIVPPAALSHPLIDLGATPEDTRRIWTEKFPQLLGYNRVDRAKPGAVVLGVDPSKNNRYGPMVMLAAQELGKGRTMAFTSDTTGGWGTYFETLWGEKINALGPLSEQNCDSRYYRRFWVNAIRWLAAGRLQSTNNPVSLELAKGYCQPNESVAATVKLAGVDAAEIAQSAVTLNLTDEKGVNQSIPARYDSFTRSYMATMTPPAAGNFTVTATAMMRGKKMGEDRQVLSAETTDLEMTEARANPKLMAAIAEISGGQVVSTATDSATLSYLWRSKVPETVEYQRTPIWDKSIWLAAILGLLSLEWILRRTKGLA